MENLNIATVASFDFSTVASFDFSNVAPEQILLITPEQTEQMNDDVFQAYHLANKAAKKAMAEAEAARKANEKAAAEKNKHRLALIEKAEKEAAEKSKMEELRKEFLLAVNPKFKREINFRATFDTETSAAEGQKSLYRSLTEKTHNKDFSDLVYLLFTSLYYHQSEAALNHLEALKMELQEQVSSTETEASKAA